MRPWVIAHNAGLEKARAGTLDAFADTLDSGCEAVEFDVRRLPDGTLVVSHDPVEAAGTAPPLDAVLDLLGHRLVCNLELKEDGYVEQVLAVARRRLPPELLLVTSAIDAVVATARRLDPGLRTGLVVGRKRDPPPTPQELVERVRATGANDLVAHHERAPLDVLTPARELGIGTLVWTVNGEDALRELLADDRVDGVITDYPRRAVALRGTAR